MQNDRTIHKKISCFRKQLDLMLVFARLQLKPGLFWYGIIQKCTKWSQIGVHGLKIGQIFAKLQCASFLIRTNVNKYTIWVKQMQKCNVCEKEDSRSYTGHTKIGKTILYGII